MSYRRREHHPDEDFARLVDHLLATRGGDAIELVWNGDVFDFDAPWVKDGTSSFDEFPLDEPGCTEHLLRILDDHPLWMSATARLLAAGHRLLVVSGNHDVELHWPAVRRALREELAERARLGPREAEERIRFRSWFHVTEDHIYLEHGSQYDLFSSVRHPMLPLTRDRSRIHPQTGKLAFKRMGARMGYLNPYTEETFYLGFLGYMRHWARFSATSRRPLLLTWFTGAVRTATEIFRHRHREDWAAENRALARAETGASDAAIDATTALAVRSGEDTMIPILRELWLDRFALLCTGIAVLVASFAVGGARATVVTALVGAGLVAVYESRTPKPDLRSYDSLLQPARLFAIHGARAVCTGHTHRPSGAWEMPPDLHDAGSGAQREPRFLGNSGSWCPAFRDASCLEPVHERRPLLLLTSEGSALWGGLCFWDGHALAAEPGSFRPPPERDRVRVADDDRLTDR